MSSLRNIVLLVVHEADVFFCFSWRDWSTTIIPGSIFSIGAMREAKHPLLITCSNYIFLLLWLAFFVYFFNLCNQIAGIEEDRINKPDRPIPSGKISLEGAWIRCAVVLASYLGMAIYERSVFFPTVLWVATALFMAFTPWGHHWFGKNNIGLTTGTWALLTTSWAAISPGSPASRRYVITFAVWIGLVIHIQDLRDIKGDIAIRRRTLPIVFGDKASRWIITLLLLPLGFWVAWLGGIVKLAPYTVVSAHIFLGYRVINVKGWHYDHKTYMITTYVFCLFIAFTATAGLDIERRLVGVAASLIG